MSLPGNRATKPLCNKLGQLLASAALGGGAGAGASAGEGAGAGEVAGAVGGAGGEDCAGVPTTELAYSSTFKTPISLPRSLQQETRRLLPHQAELLQAEGAPLGSLRPRVSVIVNCDVRDAGPSRDNAVGALCLVGARA